MNIFEKYLSKINNLIFQNKDNLKLKNFDYKKNINLEVPPEHFNFDLSSNVSLILAKSNNLNPKNLALSLKNLLLNKINHFEKVEVAGPGFLNIKLSKEGMILNINEILANKKIMEQNSQMKHLT